MLREFIQDLAVFAANNLTELVAIVHARNHDPAKVPAPEILAYEVPAAVRKLYLEVLRLVGAASKNESPAQWVDVPALLDQLGIPLQTTPNLPKDSTGLPNGRPPDLTSGQDQRREDSRTGESGDTLHGGHGKHP